MDFIWPLNRKRFLPSGYKSQRDTHKSNILKMLLVNKAAFNLHKNDNFVELLFLLTIIHILNMVVSDLSQEWPEGSLFNSYYTEV